MPPQTIELAAGAQAVINGALVTAREACTLEVGSGASVLTGRALWPSRRRLHSPSDELYFSLLDCSADPVRFAAERFRLYGLLGEVVAQDRSHEGQRECSLCAAALMAGDARGAVESAARMASTALEKRPTRTRVPGVTGARRGPIA
ncbi:MAG: hypothetical protein V2J14_11335 [Erythrobacter sp.]|jgi:hypothetical protein|nr:hypothetical protein [Erythrobacter sp.]